MNDNIYKIAAEYKIKTSKVDKILLINKVDFLSEIKWLKSTMNNKAARKLLLTNDPVKLYKLFMAFYELLPFACLSDNERVKEIILANQITPDIPGRTQLKYYFTPFEDIVREITNIANTHKGFNLDYSTLLENCLENLKGNFLKQFQWNYDMTTTRFDREVSFLNYLSVTEITMPEFDLNIINKIFSNKGDKAHEDFISYILSIEGSHRRKNLKEVILNINSETNKSGNLSDVRRLNFALSDRLSILKTDKIKCQYENGKIRDFLYAHKNLMSLINPHYYKYHVEPYLLRGEMKKFINQIQRQFNYQFEKIRTF